MSETGRSGRGNGGRGYRGGGRGGRSSGGRGGRNNNQGNRTSNKKKSLSDYVYYLGTAKQASDYETTTEYLITHIKATYTYGEDIGNALSELEAFDVDKHAPALKISTASDDKVKEAENRQYEIFYKAELDVYMKRKSQYEMNLSKSHAFLWSHCAKSMQNKLMARTDYKAKVKSDPIALLKAIKEHALNYQEHRYEPLIILDALKSALGVKQREHESLVDYNRRFKTARDVLVSHVGGPLILSKYMKTFSKYNENDPDAVETVTQEAFDRFMAVTFLVNSDQTKYGSLVTGLSTQQSLGNTQYPATVTEAHNILSNHRFDNTKRHQGNNRDRNRDRNQEQPAAEEALPLSFMQNEGKCYCCGRRGHMSPACPDKNSKPRAQWWINQQRASEHSNAQQGGSTSTPPTQSQSDDRSTAASTADQSQAGHSVPTSIQPGWAGTHVQFYQSHAAEMKDWILLDNESTTSIFCNREYVEDLRTGAEELDLSTNGGGLQTKMTAQVPGYHNRVWFDDRAITNIFAFHEMEEKYRITYDSNVEKAFCVHVAQDKVIKFKRAPNGLYYYKPPDEFRRKQPQDQAFIQTVEENKKFFTDRQVERAKKARQLYHALGTPSTADFKAIIRMNGIKNNPITVEDINIAEKIFGPDIGSLKGKSIRSKPAPAVEDYIEVPSELMAKQENVTLCMDAFKINGLPFLTTVSRHLLYRTSEFTEHQTSKVYRSVLDNVFRVYNLAGFKIKFIHCDNEFRPLMDELERVYGVQMNYANAQEHVPEAERNIRVIKERVRATFHRLPFNKIPALMLKILVMESTKKLNFFPPKGGVSKFYSPRMILHHENLDYDKHCAIPFGTYIQATEEPAPTNTQKPRTLDCVYLRYLSNKQGGHELLNLRTGCRITRRDVTPVPMTQNVIDLVHALAERDNMPDGLKVQTKTGQILYDSACIAGVDNGQQRNNNFFAPLADEDDEDIDPDYDPEDDPEEEDEDDELDPDDDITVRSDQQNAQQPEADEEAEANEDAEAEDQDQGAEDNDNAQDDESQGAEATAEVDETEQPEDHNTSEATYQTRTGRAVRAPTKMNLAQSHLYTQGHVAEEYSIESAHVIAATIQHLNNATIDKQHKHHTFVETYSLKRGIKTFGEPAKEAAIKEMKQLHDRAAFLPIDVSKLSQREKRRAMNSILFLVQKRDGTIKARTVADGSTQRGFMGKEETASPTVLTESIKLTCAIEAKEDRDVMTADIPNAFIQTMAKNYKNGDRVTLKITGVLVDLLVSIDPALYGPAVTYEGNEKVIYVLVERAIYGMLQSSLLYYKKFRKDVEEIGFRVNPYDPCVANRLVRDKQQTITWHVDDLKSSHVDPKVNDDFRDWLTMKYASDGIGEVKTVRGKRHDYLAMNLDYSIDGVCQIDMIDYVKNMVEDFPEELSTENAQYPWNEALFKVDKKSPRLGQYKAEHFHSFVARALFATCRSRPDIMPGIAFLTSRVKEPTEQDWFKLKKLMRFLKRTADDVLSLEADDTNIIEWHLDAAFAVHPDFKSHTGATMTLGKGAAQSVSAKQKVNTRSSTEAELVSVDDILSKVQWTREFLKHQGIDVQDNVIHRDNQSSMKLEENGKMSCGKRTRHFNIKYFYITDLIERKELRIQYCPTDQMVSDYMTKPLTGHLFDKFRAIIMNFAALKRAKKGPQQHQMDHRKPQQPVVQQECVGS